MDSVACDGNIIAMAISEHVENAGTHSGDATMVLPAQDINDETKTKIETIATSVAKALNVSGNSTAMYMCQWSEGGREGGWVGRGRKREGRRGGVNHCFFCMLTLCVLLV